MALTRRQIEDITADAVNLRTALAAHVSFVTADAWVAAAMDAIVISATDQLEYAPNPGPGWDLKAVPEAGGLFGTHPVETGPDEMPPDLPPDREAGQASQGRTPMDFSQAREISSRFGNLAIDPQQDLTGISPAVIERLAAGPVREGEDMRLVRLENHLASSEPARRAAESWVWDNVPGVAGICDAQYAGEVPGIRRLAPGLPPQPGSFPVYLVTYKLAGDG
jgi:hypothetical protein